MTLRPRVTLETTLLWPMAQVPATINESLGRAGVGQRTKRNILRGCKPARIHQGLGPFGPPYEFAMDIGIGRERLGCWNGGQIITARDQSHRIEQHRWRTTNTFIHGMQIGLAAGHATNRGGDHLH